MCHNNAEVHDYIKFLKYGYGKATDHAVRDIRLGRLSREDGIELAEKYDQKNLIIWIYFLIGSILAKMNFTIKLINLEMLKFGKNLKWNMGKNKFC